MGKFMATFSDESWKVIEVPDSMEMQVGMIAKAYADSQHLTVVKINKCYDAPSAGNK